MAFCSTRTSFVALLLSVLQILFLSPTIAGQYVDPWSSWSECSKTCDGEQTRTRQCIRRSSVKCEETLEDKRKCSQAAWNSWCFSEVMIITLAVIGVAILVAIIISIILCHRNRKEKKALQLNESRNESKSITEAIERRYDGSISTSHSLRHFPSISTFPDPLKEPEEMNLDNFAFDQESLNESIQSMTLAFGTDEEYQAGRTQKKDEERPVSLKVVSVTETQVIDRGSDPGKEDTPQEEKPPVYAVVVKPPKDTQTTVDNTAM